MKRQLISSGSEFENKIGYSRAVAVDRMVFVSGTTGYDYESMIISDDILEQTAQCIKNIEAALIEAGSSLKDIVRITYILPDADEFEKCWPILKKAFADIKPAATMISAGLANDKMKIEIEVTAIKS